MPIHTLGILRGEQSANCSLLHDTFTALTDQWSGLQQTLKSLKTLSLNVSDRKMDRKSLDAGQDSVYEDHQTDSELEIAIDEFFAEKARRVEEEEVVNSKHCTSLVQIQASCENLEYLDLSWYRLGKPCIPASETVSGTLQWRSRHQYMHKLALFADF